MMLQPFSLAAFTAQEHFGERRKFAHQKEQFLFCSSCHGGKAVNNFNFIDIGDQTQPISILYKNASQKEGEQNFSLVLFYVE